MSHHGLGVLEGLEIARTPLLLGTLLGEEVAKASSVEQRAHERSTSNRHADRRLGKAPERKVTRRVGAVFGGDEEQTLDPHDADDHSAGETGVSILKTFLGGWYSHSSQAENAVERNLLGSRDLQLPYRRLRESKDQYIDGEVKSSHRNVDAVLVRTVSSGNRRVPIEGERRARQQVDQHGHDGPADYHRNGCPAGNANRSHDEDSNVEETNRDPDEPQRDPVEHSQRDENLGTAVSEAFLARSRESTRGLQYLARDRHIGFADVRHMSP